MILRQGFMTYAATHGLNLQNPSEQLIGSTQNARLPANVFSMLWRCGVSALTRKCLFGRRNCSALEAKSLAQGVAKTTARGMSSVRTNGGASARFIARRGAS